MRSIPTDHWDASAIPHIVKCISVGDKIIGTAERLQHRMIVQPSTYLRLSSKHLAAMNLRGDTRLTNLRNANQMKEYLPPLGHRFRSEDNILGGPRELTMKHRKLLQILEILRVPERICLLLLQYAHSASLTI